MGPVGGEGGGALKKGGGRRPPWWPRFSLRRKVPLIAGALILGVAFAVSFVGYLEVRHTARRAAYQHVQDIARIVASAQRNNRQIMAAARRDAADPALAAYVARPTAARRIAALATLASRSRTGGGTLLGTELLNARGNVLLTSNPRISAHPGEFPPTIAPGDSSSLGRIQLVDDSIVFPVSALIPNESGAFLVQWRHVTAEREERERTEQLLGARLLLGNTDGTVWTNLDTVVTAPVGDLTDTSGAVTEYTRHGPGGSDGLVIGSITKLAGTPWSVAVEIPRAQIMAPAARFFRAMIVITLILAGIALLIAFHFARSLTGPLDELTEAASAVAAGRHTAELPVHRHDEVGRLASAFAAMSDEVRDARETLEQRVEQRTRELKITVGELRETQAALVRREKLAMLGQLAGGVGHELRNPLGVMSNAIYYLEMVLESPSANVAEYLRLLREQVVLSTRIVDDLLNFARIAPAQRRTVTLQALVAAQIARLEGHHGVDITVELESALPAATVDEVQLGQVIFNLLTNALQAIGSVSEGGEGREGQIRISAACPRADTIELIVADTGPGIAPELIEQIFEPLFTTRARGFGLGLAVSRTMAQANGGDIRVTSEPGKGATFTVTMPSAVRVIA